MGPGLREGVTFSQGPSAGSTRLELSFPKSIDMPMFLRRSFPENVRTCLGVITQDAPVLLWMAVVAIKFQREVQGDCHPLGSRSGALTADHQGS